MYGCCLLQLYSQMFIHLFILKTHNNDVILRFYNRSIKIVTIELDAKVKVFFKSKRALFQVGQLLTGEFVWTRVRVKTKLPHDIY